MDAQLYGAARMARAAETTAAMAESVATQLREQEATSWNALSAALDAAARRTTVLAVEAATAAATPCEAQGAQPWHKTEKSSVAATPYDSSSGLGAAVAAAQERDAVVARLMDEALRSAAHAEASGAALAAMQETAVPLSAYADAMATTAGLRLELDAAVATLADAQQIAERHSAVAFASGGRAQHAGTSPTLAPAPPATAGIAPSAWWLDAVRQAEAQALRAAAEHHHQAPVAVVATQQPASQQTQARLDAALRDVRALTIENAAMAEQIAHMLACSSTIGATARAAELGRCPSITKADLLALGMTTLPSFESLSGYSNAQPFGGAACHRDPDDSATVDGVAAVDLSPLCYDDAYALLERMRELIRLTAHAHTAPTAEAGAKRNRAEVEKVDLHHHDETRRETTAAAPAQRPHRSIAVNTDLILALEDDVIDRDRRDQTDAAQRFAAQARRVEANERHSATLEALMAGFDATNAVFDSAATLARAALSEKQEGGVLACINAYASAAVANRTTIEAQQRRITELDEAKTIHTATIAALEAELAASYATATAVPTLTRHLDALKQQTAEFTNAVQLLKASATLSQSDASAAAVAIGDVARHIAETTARLEEQHGVVSAALVAASAPKAEDDASAAMTAATAAQLTSTVERLEAELAVTSAALRDERQRAIDALDANWQHELRALEAVAAFDKLKAESEFFVPMGTVATLQAELRDALDQKNSLAEEVAQLRLGADVSAAQLRQANADMRAAETAAQSKLDVASQNVSNLNDSLRKATAERDAAAERTTRAQHDANVLVGRVSMLEKQVEAAKRETLEAEGRVKSLQAEFLSGNVRAETLKEAFGSASEAVEIAVHRIAGLEAELDASKQALELVTGDKTALEAMLHNATAEAAERRATALSASLELTAVRRQTAAEVAEANKLAAAATEDASHLRRALEVAQADLAASVAREEQLKRRVDILAAEPGTVAVRRHGLAQAEDLTKQVDELAAREQAALDSLKKTQDQLRKLEAQFDASQRRGDKLEVEHRAVQEALAAQTQATDEALQAVTEREDELAAAQERVQALEEQVGRLESSLEETQRSEQQFQTSLAVEASRVVELQSEQERAREALAQAAADAAVHRTRLQELLDEKSAAADTHSRLVRDNVQLHTQRLQLEGIVADLQNKLAEARTARAAVVARGRPSGALDTSARRSTSVAAMLRASSANH